jgi:FAD/FMN-containing dehydrogenase
VQAQAGVLLGELDRATQAFALAVPVGSVTHTGLAGLTLGGGIGWLMRKHGLTVDQLLSAQVVTADGATLTASHTENTDLFWGVRGGGGNFGIVTSFELRLHAVGPTVHSGLLLWPLEQGPEVVRRYRDWAASAPDELTTALIMRRAPVVDSVPERLRGKPAVVVASCWVGPLERADTVLEPLRHVGAPVDLSSARSFVEHQSVFDPNFPHGMWAWSRATNVSALTDDVLDTMLDHAARIRSRRSAITAWQLGGAVARVGAMDTPFGSRASAYLVDFLGATDSAQGFDSEQSWAHDGWTALTPHHAGAYVNWLMEEGEERVRQSYGAERFDRLRDLKRRYDPDNLFRLNQNIRPRRPPSRRLLLARRQRPNQLEKPPSLGSSRSLLASSSTLTSLNVTTRTFLTNRAGR